ncbi:hypothetical protein HK102_006361 [Quaeritorhiza haematococci]|nr:hypothetical protein HK102_006361 [Quaeritorhiza haematococci]
MGLSRHLRQRDPHEVHDSMFGVRESALKACTGLTYSYVFARVFGKDPTVPPEGRFFKVIVIIKYWSMTWYNIASIMEKLIWTMIIARRRQKQMLDCRKCRRIAEFYGDIDSYESTTTTESADKNLQRLQRNLRSMTIVLAFAIAAPILQATLFTVTIATNQRGVTIMTTHTEHTMVAIYAAITVFMQIHSWYTTLSVSKRFSTSKTIPLSLADRLTKFWQSRKPGDKPNVPPMYFDKQ